MIAGVIVILLVFVLLKPPSVERDPKTLCRSEGPLGDYGDPARSHGFVHAHYQIRSGDSDLEPTR